jgi:hypothetical protein
VNADRLVINFSKGWGTTFAGCPAEREPQVAAFMSGLRQSERFAVQKRRLTIFYDGGNSELVFEAACP